MAELSEPAFARAPDIITTEVDGGFILLNPENWTYLEFDNIGNRIWDCLSEPRTLTALVEELQQEYSVDAETCKHDTEVFLRGLTDQGFVISPTTV